jgi:hypothetical protein
MKISGTIGRIEPGFRFCVRRIPLKGRRLPDKLLVRFHCLLAEIVNNFREGPLFAKGQPANLPFHRGLKGDGSPMHEKKDAIVTS